MNKSKEKAVILIDGSNFYHRLKEPELDIKNLLDFDYGGFADWLLRDRILVKKQYYIGVIRADPNDKKAQELRRNQQRLFSLLGKNGWHVSYGFILKEGGYHEKGVDVKIAVDLLVGAYENNYDIAILVSSDTDLLPAIQKVKELGKKIEYIGFAHKPSFAMQKHASISRLLIKDELLKFVKS